MGKFDNHAQKALVLWNGDPATLLHLGDAGNYVYQVSCHGIKRILRLTDPAYRSVEHNLAELDFLQHLTKENVSVSAPLATNDGQLLCNVSHDGLTLCASLFEFAHGERVETNNPLWSDVFIHAWGSALGAIHKAALSYAPKDAAKRWQWDQEELIINATNYILPGHEFIYKELQKVLSQIRSIVRNEHNYGLIHADFGPQNFHLHPTVGITSFDFGNCCYHYYAADIAIALGVLRRLEPKKYSETSKLFMSGYGENYSLDREDLRYISLFVQLRRVYVYLSRIKQFGANLPIERKQEIERICTALTDPSSWLVRWL